jgi:hypothetical protein
MTKFRLAVAAAAAAATIGVSAPAQADSADVCATRLARLVEQFYDQADRHGYDKASDWWQARWHAYYVSCVA